MTTTPPPPKQVTAVFASSVGVTHETDDEGNHMIWAEANRSVAHCIGAGSTFREAKADALANLKALMEELREMRE